MITDFLYNQKKIDLTFDQLRNYALRIRRFRDTPYMYIPDEKARKCLCPVD